MPDAEHQDHQHVLLHFKQDAILPHSNSAQARGTAFELSTLMRVASEAVNGGDYPHAVRFG
jgi:hypothetical protein